ncbi:hypothetical protein BKA93DRAFT_756475 [Sparassis latifolia]
MRSRKTSGIQKLRIRRSSTPTTPSGNLEIKRQYLKKQRIKQHRQRKQEAQQQSQRKHSYRRIAMLVLAAVKAKREQWATIARETQEIVLGDGKYVEERHLPVVFPAVAQLNGQGLGLPSTDMDTTLRVTHDISAQIQLSRQGTTFYPHYSDLLATWASKRPTTAIANTAIEFTRTSTLTAAHVISNTHPHLYTHSPSSLSLTTLGVLSFASPKKPGGGCLHGGDEQEETIARLSSLVASLSVPAAREFYKEHKAFKVEDGSGLHDHSMVYSPGVVVFRSDWDDTLIASDESPRNAIMSNMTDLADDSVGGDFIPPYTINVVSSVPVNAAAVRAKHLILPSEAQLFEDGIRSAMKERMGRVLRIFEERGDRVIVLGAFGCGSSQNKVETIASLWAELLVCGDSQGKTEGGSEGQQHEARFKNSFEKVVFAVPGKLFDPFKTAFDMRIFEEEVAMAAAGTG